jgi:hypothetical protein
MDEEQFKGALGDIADANIFQLFALIEASARTLAKRLDTPPHGDLTERARENGLAHAHTVLASAHNFKAQPASS